MTKYQFQCPACRSTDNISVEATIWVNIIQFPDGEWESETTPDWEFKNNSPAECMVCNHCAPFSAFHTQD